MAGGIRVFLHKSAKEAGKPLLSRRIMVNIGFNSDSFAHFPQRPVEILRIVHKFVMCLYKLRNIWYNVSVY